MLHWDRVLEKKEGFALTSIWGEMGVTGMEKQYENKRLSLETADR